MEIFYFLSGVCVVTIFAMAVAVFGNYRKIGRLRNELSDLIDNLATDLENDLDRVEDDLETSINTMEKILTDEVIEIYRSINSRLNKLSDLISNLNK